MKRRHRRSHIHPPSRVPRPQTGFGIPLQSNVAPMGREFKPLPPIHTGDPSRIDKNFNGVQSDEEVYTGPNSEFSNAYYAVSHIAADLRTQVIDLMIRILGCFLDGTTPSKYNDVANPHTYNSYISLSSP
ncbi:hypothetical protein K443DRAFT_296044 [Laccaria amethystina LaAM-08-1]|uniref:Uncharacterized protein n=1 Tax=Laccaria amethystina LaAM-08-1 TaxID=1095629 RepID=A0A0C9XIR1_9AGAR|nr:hypothetical protein K443DRAFT_296044 [Laccaria amethystina LaAM-08-1]